MSVSNSWLPLGTNPNHVGYDPATKYLYIGFRDERSGRLAIVDTSTGRPVGDIRTDALPGGVKIESKGKGFRRLRIRIGD